MDLGRGQHKDGVRRRFLESFEQGVERLIREHVDFVDNVDLVFTLGRRKVDLIAQITDIIHAGVGGRVDLDEIQKTILVDSFAVVTLVVGTLRTVWVETVDGLCQETRQCGLPRPT